MGLFTALLECDHKPIVISLEKILCTDQINQRCVYVAYKRFLRLVFFIFDRCYIFMAISDPLLNIVTVQ